ncbi:MAG: 50S ribosomal protein L25/general stress protein Ctc [Proteobacteria bacterium]|nr:50S ribosomal protein L25/general stress protein Ctc [Pseudomonadota bacterium]
MSDLITLTATVRTDVGKGASRRLRRLEDKVPAIIYGGEIEPQKLTLLGNEIFKASQVEAFYSQVLDVAVDGKVQPAVIRDLQRNPASGRIQHIDFQRISADKEINVSVPLHFINEAACVGVKMSGGTLTHNLTEVEITCLPANLPEFIEVDMLEVEAGSSVHLSDLKLQEGVTIVALTFGEDRDIPVASVTARRGASEDGDDTAAPVAGDGEASSGEDEGGED